MSKIVDARGLACPQPVVLTSKVIAVADEATVIVDNAAAVENVTRFARSKGFSTKRTEKPDGIYLMLRREGAPPVGEPEPVVCCQTAAPARENIVLLMASEFVGRGSDELGKKLTGAFFNALLETGPKPKTVILMNSGAKLAVEGSPVLEDLRELERQGVEILSCGTCLNYFGIADKLAVGRVSNMFEIVSTILAAGKLIQP